MRGCPVTSQRARGPSKGPLSGSQSPGEMMPCFGSSRVTPLQCGSRRWPSSRDKTQWVPAWTLPHLSTPVLLSHREGGYRSANFAWDVEAGIRNELLPGCSAQLDRGFRHQRCGPLTVAGARELSVLGKVTTHPGLPTFPGLALKALCPRSHSWDSWSTQCWTAQV